MNRELPLDAKMREYREAIALDAVEHAKNWAQKSHSELLEMSRLCAEGGWREVLEMDKVANREVKCSASNPIFKMAGSDRSLGDFRKVFRDDLRFLWRDVFADEALWLAMCMVQVREDESEAPNEDEWDFLDSTERFD